MSESTTLYDVRGELKGAGRALDRPLDGGVRRHLATAP